MASDYDALVDRLSYDASLAERHIHAFLKDHNDQILDSLFSLLSNNAVNDLSLAALNAALHDLKAVILPIYNDLLALSASSLDAYEKSDLLKRIHRFLQLLKRLSDFNLSPNDPVSTTTTTTTTIGTGVNEREIARAATCICEIEALLSEVDLSGIEVVDKELDFIANSKLLVVDCAEKLLDSGLKSQNQGDIASGLQIFYNLTLMPTKTITIIDSILETVTSKIHSTFTSLKVPSENTGGNTVGSTGPFTSNSMWTGLEKLMDFMYDEAVKVYTLEKVLMRKKDLSSGIVFLNEVVKVLEEPLIDYFWRSVSTYFEKELRVVTKATPALHTTFQAGYPKLLRLFHDFFSRIAVFNGIKISPDSTSPELALLLKPLHQYESAYTNRCLARLLDALNSCFAEKSVLSGSVGSLNFKVVVPSRDDVEKLFRLITSELDTAKFDKSLMKSVTKNISRTLNGFITKCENINLTDPNTVINSPPTGPPSMIQMTTIELVNSVWLLTDLVWNLGEEFESDVLSDMLQDNVVSLNRLIQKLVEPLLMGLTKELEGILIKIYKEDYGRTGKQGNKMNEAAASPYMIELSQRLRWMQREVLSKLNCGDDSKDWIKQIGSRVITYFLRHASLLQSLSEPGKLKLASDMTQLEFTLTQLLSSTRQKLEHIPTYKSLRQFRQLMFFELKQFYELGDDGVDDVDKVMVLHYLMGRSVELGRMMPVSLFGWTELQYSEWMDIHDGDGVVLLERCVDMYVEEVKKKGEKEFAVEYPVIRHILGM
ncbi:Conserved oligomeric Golgi complex subunit [Nowakowskiella sp. JEL0407]|nr:Conserved oligomeric Golgi complex subunit [Nowakowskiella sp. JEL0407]